MSVFRRRLAGRLDGTARFDALARQRSETSLRQIECKEMGFFLDMQDIYWAAPLRSNKSCAKF